MPFYGYEAPELMEEERQKMLTFGSLNEVTSLGLNMNDYPDQISSQSFNS